MGLEMLVPLTSRAAVESLWTGKPTAQEVGQPGSSNEPKEASTNAPNAVQQGAWIIQPAREEHQGMTTRARLLIRSRSDARDDAAGIAGHCS